MEGRHMENHTDSSHLEEEVLQDLTELEGLVQYIPEHKGDATFQSHIYDLVDILQELCPFSKQEVLIRKLVAQFGDAYFFYNQTGDLCLLTDFVNDARSTHLQFQAK